MPTNEFLPWATATGANVMTQAAYAANTALAMGVGIGIADPTLYNKQAKQSSAVIAMIGQFINDVGNLDALDNTNLAQLEANFISALTAHLQLHLATNVLVFATPGTTIWTVPAGVYRPFGRGCGGGGGGGWGSGSATWSGGGGGSGGYFEGYFSVTPGQSIPITIGAGGGGGTGTGAAGNGGTTSLGTYMSATGGQGGNAGSVTSAGGAPGVGSGGQLNLYGANGGEGNNLSATTPGGYGASSAFGGGGRSSTITIADSNGKAPGSGGGGIWQTVGAAQVGGNGAAGTIIITYSQ